MMRLGAHYLALVAFVVFFCGLSGTARATTEYCPARVSHVHEFPADTSGTAYAFLLDAESTRSVQARIVASTADGYYGITLPAVAISLDQAQYRAGSSTFTRNEYHSPVVYARFPPGVTAKEFWIDTASATNDSEFGWSSRGTVHCYLEASVRRSTSSRNMLNVTRLNQAPYDVTRPPLAGDTVLDAVKTTPPGRTDCAMPFAPASVTTAARPQLPMGYDISGPVTTLVQVAVSKDGAPDDVWVLLPSGIGPFDQSALRAARTSHYKPGTSFCETAPGMYIFRADFQP